MKIIIIGENDDLVLEKGGIQKGIFGELTNLGAKFEGLTGTVKDYVDSTNPDVSNFITASVNNLLNYYLKEETYTKAEVQALIGAVSQFTYQVVEELPTASDSTMRKIYLIPAGNSEEQNIKDEYITLDNGEEAETRYTWEQIGTTAVDLSNYFTKSQTNSQISSALNEALASYTTTVALTALLAGKQDALVSGTNIKTVNGQSLLGSGNTIINTSDSVVETVEDGLYVTDELGNVGAKLTDDGFKGVGCVDSCKNLPRPERIITIEYFTDNTLPTRKDESNPILAYGRIKINIDGIEIYKYATLEVQGASSATYPKKNWTFGLFNDAEYTDSYKLRIGNMVPHDEYVFKANYIDATHCRNIVCNRLWEQITMSRPGYPKREFDMVYDETATDVVKRVDTGALGHVDGFPCVLYINGAFYGIGDFNIGKKRDNYNLSKNNQNHIQMQAEDHVDFLSYNANKWEIRNPKNPDNDFATKIAAWFASNDPTDADFKTNFETTHNLQNAIDYLIFIEFIMADDCVDKNFQLTTWDGTVFSFMPYDLDTVFNLWWNGTKYTDPVDPSVIHSTNNIVQSAADFWDGFLDAYKAEIVARYNDLKAKGIISVDNIYNLCTELSTKYGADLYQQEYAKWTNIPSNTTIHTSIPQILDWCEDRIAWMDTHFVISNNNNE